MWPKRKRVELIDNINKTAGEVYLTMELSASLKGKKSKHGGRKNNKELSLLLGGKERVHQDQEKQHSKDWLLSREETWGERESYTIPTWFSMFSHCSLKYNK